jgi:hypothetical protein
MAGLLPFLRHKHGDDIAKCFNPLAINIHKESTWDPETQEVVTAADHQVATLAEINPEMDCKIERRHWIIDSPPKTKHKTKTGKSDQSQQGIQGGVMSHASDAWGDKINWDTSQKVGIWHFWYSFAKNAKFSDSMTSSPKSDR